MLRTTGLVLLALIASAPLATGQDAGTETAAQVRGWCRGLAAVREDPNHGFRMPNDRHAEFCWGAFGALQQVMRYVNDDGKAVLHVCAPESSTRLQLIRIFAQFVSAHPEKEHENFVTEAVLAMQGAFPCQ